MAASLPTAPNNMGQQKLNECLQVRMDSARSQSGPLQRKWTCDESDKLVFDPTSNRGRSIGSKNREEGSDVEFTSGMTDCAFGVRVGDHRD